MLENNIEVGILPLAHYDLSYPFPQYASSGAAGLDLRAMLGIGKVEYLQPRDIKLIPTGLCMEIPSGYEGQIRMRSGLALKQGLMLLNAPGTIDSDYRGEIKIIVANFSEKAQAIEHGGRIAQIVFTTYSKASWVVKQKLEETVRNEQGFGSTRLN